MTANKPMTSEQLSDLMTVAVSMQRDSEKAGDRHAAMFAYAVQVAVLELRKVRDDSAALAAENAGLKEWASERAICDDALEQLNYTKLKIDWRQRSFAAIETPASDAFLAEVRAQGVVMFAECAHTLEHHDHAVAFAAQLRKGVQL